MSHLELIPAEVSLKMVRGDTFLRKLFQASEFVDPADSEKGFIPININEIEFLFEIRVDRFESDCSSPLLSVGMEYLFYGQSEHALQYDIDQGNPGGTTWDELHAEIPPELTKIDPGRWWHGIRATYPTGVVELLWQHRVRVIADVPRKSK